MNTAFTLPRIATGLLIILAVAFAVYFFSARNDNRNAFQRMGDAVEELPDGLDKAAGQLEDRSPAQKAGDAIEDAGENMKRSVE